MNTKSKINHVDCFAGPGGICTGFKAAGIDTLVAIEKVDSCVETYKANHRDVKVLTEDIRKVTNSQLQEAVAGKEVHILTSGMPCETFSTAGSSSRSFYDSRQQLYSEAIRLAVAVNSKMILFENVPGIESKKIEKDGKRFVVQDILEELHSTGYTSFIKTVLDSSEFGIPQIRRRFFILATNDENLKLRIPRGTTRIPLTVEDAFLGLPDSQANDRTDHKNYTGDDNEYTKLLKNRSFWKIENDLNGEVSYQIAPNHRPGTIQRFNLIGPGESLVDLFKRFDDATIKGLQADRVLPKKWYIQRNKRLELTAPSKTVTSHCLDELVHPYLNRGLTVREVARLQSFPDFYDFKGGPFICPHIYETQDKYEQIGDAVPPLLAYHWGKTIIEIISLKELTDDDSRGSQRVLF